MPGGFDQQSASVSVAGLGHPALAAGVARGVLAGHQPDVGADAASSQPVPVADLDGQPERRQRRDPTNAAQPVHHRGELAVGGHRGDRVVESGAPVPTGQHRVEGRLEGQL